MTSVIQKERISHIDLHSISRENA